MGPRLFVAGSRASALQLAALQSYPDWASTRWRNNQAHKVAHHRFRCSHKVAHRRLRSSHIAAKRKTAGGEKFEHDDGLARDERSYDVRTHEMHRGPDHPGGQPCARTTRRQQTRVESRPRRLMLTYACKPSLYVACKAKPA